MLSLTQLWLQYICQLSLFVQSIIKTLEIKSVNSWFNSYTHLDCDIGALCIATVWSIDILNRDMSNVDSTDEILELLTSDSESLRTSNPEMRYHHHDWWRSNFLEIWLKHRYGDMRCHRWNFWVSDFRFRISVKIWSRWHIDHYDWWRSNFLEYS